MYKLYDKTRGIPAIILTTISIFLFIGCVTFKPINKPLCINPADYPNSLIIQTLGEACEAHEWLVTIAEVGVAMDSFTYEDLHNKIVKWIDILSTANAISAKSVKDVILKELARIDKKVAAGLWVVSGKFLAFDDEAVFGSDDIGLLILSLKDIDRKTRAITVFK